jgi:hypothetical protein
VRADHLPDELISKTQTEHLLAGIDVYKTTYVHPVELTRQRTEVKELPVEDCKTNKCGGFEVVEWRDNGCSIIIASDYGAEVPVRHVYSVEVRRFSSANTKTCSTGRGVSIGDSFSKAIIAYGNRFFVSRQSPKTILYQWLDDTTLQLEMAPDNSIQAMHLTASIE